MEKLFDIQHRISTEKNDLDLRKGFSMQKKGPNSPDLGKKSLQMPRFLW